MSGNIVTKEDEYSQSLGQKLTHATEDTRLIELKVAVEWYSCEESAPRWITTFARLEKW